MEWDWENVTAFLLVVGGLITALSPILISFLQAQNRKPVTEADRTKIMAESWQLIVNELQEEVDRLTKKVDGLEKKLDAQEKKHDEAMQRQAVEYSNKEQGLKATIEGLQQRITELDNQQKSIKRTTDELEKKTGPLPPLP